MSIARYYDESKNPEGATLPGVPLADLSETEFEAQPDWVKRSIDAHPMYRKTKPPSEKAETKEEPKKADVSVVETTPAPEQVTEAVEAVGAVKKGEGG